MYIYMMSDSEAIHETDPSDVAAPLDDIRILSVEQFGAGPLGTMYLSDMGADVVKIEEPSQGGDIGRHVPPGQLHGTSLYFEAFNRGKRSIALDLKSPAGKAVFHRMVKSADAVFSNLRGDQPSALGLTYEQLAPHNPAIVCVALTGYGRAGPRASHPAYDALVQAEAGWAALTGDPSGPPTKSGLSLADYVAGITAALATVVAIHAAKRSGTGCDVDVTLFDTALAMLTYPATWFLSIGHVAERYPMSSHPSIVPFQFFETQDGHIAVACPKDKFFRTLADILGRPDLKSDPRYTDFDARSLNRVDLLADLTAEFRRRTTTEWMRQLEGRVPVAPVRSVEKALNREELARRSMLVEYEHDALGHVESVGNPMRVNGYDPVARPGPMLGQDHEAIVAELEYTPEELASLRAGGAFGQRLMRGGK